MLCHPGVCYSDRWAVALVDSGPSSSKEACGRSVRGGWATEWFVSLVAVCTCGPHAFAAVHFPLFFLVSYPVLGEAQWSTPIHLPTPTPSASPVSSSPRTAVASTPSKRTTSSAVPLQQTASRSRFSPMDSRPSLPDRPHLQQNRAPKWSLIRVGPHISSCFLLFRCRL